MAQKEKEIMEDLLVHKTECPFCGRTFKRIEEAIQKEKGLWNMPDSWTESPDSTTLDNDRNQNL